MKPTITTPGVYINELNAFPNSVVAVATAVPAFIGYTPQASYEGKSFTNIPQKITSFAEFQAIYCYSNPSPPAAPVQQYSPQFYAVQQKTQPIEGDSLLIRGSYYAILPDPGTIYYLYNSIRLFYQNGGGDAYIVSVGGYGPAIGKSIDPGDLLVNLNVRFDDLLAGLAVLENEDEPTMYICPEATLMKAVDNGELMQAMLQQGSRKGTAVSILDVAAGRNPDPLQLEKDIALFRDQVGSAGLDFGAAYYPFIGTTIMQSADLDYTNLFGGDLAPLAAILTPPEAPEQTVAAIIAAIQNPGANPLSVSQNQNALLIASKLYETIMKHVLNQCNLLPPSGALAGVITLTDSQVGVWQAPANISITGAASLPINISDSQQAGLNVDAVSGKSINAIRFFNGQGILVWGARTLDGNSLDWKYLPVKRTIIFLEQSCRLAVSGYTFQPNDQNTWEAVKAMISSFLNSVWKQGGLVGSTPEAAFSVDCGLGTTMVAEDVLNGFMNVTVKVAVTHPAEYIVITFQQQMAR
ncbi:MAG: phage tail sheath C-terminal domain-containing protein [Bacteroidota bacterium]